MDEQQVVIVGFDDGSDVVVVGAYPAGHEVAAARHYLALPREGQPFSKLTTLRRMAQLTLPRVRLSQQYGLPFFMNNGTPICDWRILPPPRRSVTFMI